eukprot:4403486-Prymnesium_polylepis.1
MSEKELQLLQWPPLVVETRQRSAALRKLLGGAAPSGTPPHASNDRRRRAPRRHRTRRQHVVLAATPIAPHRAGGLQVTRRASTFPQQAAACASCGGRRGSYSREC